MHKKIAVIGATGFIGKSFVQHATAAGHQVTAITRTDVDFTLDNAFAPMINLISDCDTVVVLAALTPKKNLTSVQYTQRFMDNLRIAENVIKAIDAVNTKQVLYISSDGVYSPQLTELTEDAPTEPDYFYGWAHKMRENLFIEIARNRSLCILRPCAVFGAHDPHNAYGASRFMREAITQSTINLFGNGEELRNHIHVQDVAQIMLHAITLNLAGIYNVAPQPAVSFMEVAEKISKIIPTPISINCLPRTIPLQHRTHNTIKLQNALGAFSFTPLETSLELLYKELNFKPQTQESIHAGS